MPANQRETSPSSHGIWDQASRLARQTPDGRNRTVDFLRALSILAVVAGHWLMAAPLFQNRSPHMIHLLDASPWTQWLTWVFQVMPVFFFVGGFSNRISWKAAQAKGRTYPFWLATRLDRLLQGVLWLVVIWAVFGVIGRFLGIPHGMIRVGSQISLVPVWFLAVYVLVILLVPVTQFWWEKWGYLSIAVLTACAAVIDVLFFAADLRSLGFANYPFVWLAVHQLGYAWCDRRIPKVRGLLLLSAAGLACLMALVTWGPYPLSLVGVPGDSISNTLPPKLPLLALCAAQFGLLLAIERPMRRFLERLRPWTWTVLINSMIMTIFLWHSTAMILVIGLTFWVRPDLVSLVPGTASWWLWRPVWMIVYGLCCFVFVALFARFERSRPDRNTTRRSAFRLVLGSLVACGGLAFLAFDGVAATHGLGIRVLPVLAPIFGALVAGTVPMRLRRTA